MVWRREPLRANASADANWSAASVFTSPWNKCHDLLDNDVAGIHFYTLNRSDATRTIFDSLGIPRQRNAPAPIA